MAREKNPKKYFGLSVSAELLNLKAEDPEPEVSVYAFSADGQLLATAPVKKGGQAKLRVPAPATRDRVRVLLGPPPENESAEYDDLMRRGAQQQFLLVDAKDTAKEASFQVIPDIWQCWILRPCFVRGKLLKRVIIGGETVDLPVCTATVDVYEVDPLHILIPRLPIDILDRLRAIIVHPWPWPPELIPTPVPGPIPGPIFQPVPRPVPGPDPAPFARRMMLSAPAASGSALAMASGSGPAPEAAQALEQILNTTELRYIAQTGSAVQFQQALIDHVTIVRPLLCWFFPWLVIKHKVATATTDACGNFQTLFFRGCNDTDIPDLYFKAHQRLFGFFDVTIYEPLPVACHTYWDYICGTEVTLYTTSPLAHTCSPCPPVVGSGNWVAFLAIGAHALSHIYGTAPDLQASTTSDNLGLTDGSTGVHQPRPWGGLLRPRVEFSNAIEELGVKYYQISWRKGDSGDFLPLTGSVTHYYRHDVTTPSGTVPAWSPYVLGPKDVDDGAGHQVPNLFEIPYPSVAPAGVWDAPPHISEIVDHFGNAKFPTQELAPGMTYDAVGNTVGTDAGGKYQLKLDLFDAHGQAVNIAALGIQYVVPDVPDLTGTISTTPAAPLGLVDGDSMIITLHVDNNPCFANIDAPTIGALAADPCCGVLEYTAGDSVEVSWTAKHPNGFAVYHFWTVRGDRTVLQEPGPGAWGPVGTGSFSVTPAVTNLLNDNLPPGCPVDGCPVAGFTEHLYVDSLATNGWTHELGYDAQDLRAFALASSTS